MAAPNLKVVPSVPEALRDRKQWVLWKRGERDGKLTKLPYNPRTGALAQSDNPATWGTLPQTMARYQREAAWDGIGYVFAADDPYCGIDLDGCIDPETGAVIPAALEIVQLLDSYTEISPSGQGLHILIEATLPPGRRVAHDLGIEMYSQGRFFTVTGRRLNDTAPAINQRTTAIAALHRKFFGEAPAKSEETPAAPPTNLDDRLLLDIATRAVNGARFAGLWRGDTSYFARQENDGHSEADLALCNYLAFYTGDRMRTDALFRQSGLMREKWDEKHYADGRTYGENTIELAFAGRTAFYTPRPRLAPERAKPSQKTPPAPDGDDPNAEKDAPRYRFLSDAESDNLPPITWLVPGVIPHRSIGSVYGDSQSAKTFFLVDLGLSLACARPWKGVELQASTVAYIAGEDPYGVAERKRAWKSYYHRSSVPGFYLLTENVPLMRNDDLHHLILALQALPKPLGLIIIDTLSCAMVGGDGNNTKDVVFFMEVVKLLRTTFDCSVLLAHHKNKSGGELGNVTLRNSCDVMIEMVKDGELVTAKSEKSKNAKPFTPILMTLKEHDGSALLVSRSSEVENGELPDSAAKALYVLVESFPAGTTALTWMKATGLTEATFYRALATLRTHLFINDTNGRRGESYVASPHGRSYHHSHVTITAR